MTSRMPFTPRTQPGESPLSLLRRAAHGNGAPSALRYAFSFNPQLDHSETALGTLARNPSLLQATAESMGIPQDEIDQAIYERSGFHGQERLTWNGLQVLPGDLSFRRAKTCMACIQQHGYARSEWDHRASIACAEHLVLLESECPVCHVPWTHDEGLLSCQCSLDQMRHHSIPVPESAASLLSRLISAKDQIGLALLTVVERLLAWWSLLGLAESALAKALAMRDLHGGHWPAEVTLPVHRQALHPRVALAPLLTSPMPEARSLAARLLKQTPPAMTAVAPERTVIAQHAMKILGVQRVAFAKLVRDGRVGKTDGGFLISDLNRLLLIATGRPADGQRPLADLRAGKVPMSLSNLLEEIETGRIVNFHFPLDSGLQSLQAVAPAQSALALPAGCMTLAEVAARIDIHPEYVRSVIKSGLLPAKRGWAASGVQWLVQHDAVEQFDADYVFASRLATSLGAAATTFASRLRSAGLLPVSGPGIDGGLTYLFRRSHVDALDLAAILSGPYQSPAGRRRGSTGGAIETWSWTETARRLGISSKQLHQVVADAWLAPIALTARVKRFDPPAVRSLQHRLANEYRSISASAAVCGQSPDQFRRCWIDSGVIAAHRFGDLRLVAVADLDALRRRHGGLATASEIGRLAGRPRTLCSNLEKIGAIEVADVVGTGTRKVKLYSRSASVLSRLLPANPRLNASA